MIANIHLLNLMSAIHSRKVRTGATKEKKHLFRTFHRKIFGKKWLHFFINWLIGDGNENDIVPLSLTIYNP